jgi:hypothetical protein
MKRRSGSGCRASLDQTGGAACLPCFLGCTVLVPVVVMIVIMIVVVIVPPGPVFFLLVAVQSAKVAVVVVIFHDPLMVVDSFMTVS